MHYPDSRWRPRCQGKSCDNVSGRIWREVTSVAGIFIGELGRWVHAKRVDGEEGVVLSQHGRDTQDREVQRWVYELESQMEQRQLFNEGDMGQGDWRTKGQWKDKSSGHKHMGAC